LVDFRIFIRIKSLKKNQLKFIKFFENFLVFYKNFLLGEKNFFSDHPEAKFSSPKISIAKEMAQHTKMGAAKPSNKKKGLKMNNLFFVRRGMQKSRSAAQSIFFVLLLSFYYFCAAISVVVKGSF
jgi:hypothetical protein